MKELLFVLGKEFAYELYPCFRFDKSLLELDASSETEDEDLPFN